MFVLLVGSSKLEKYIYILFGVKLPTSNIKMPKTQGGSSNIFLASTFLARGGKWAGMGWFGLSR